MKKILNYTLVLLAGLALMTACSKEADITSDESPANQGGQESTSPATDPEAPAGDMTITVSMPDVLTRVSLTQDSEDPDGAVKMAWEATDKIYVNGEEFTIVTPLGEDPHKASFTGPSVTAPYNIIYGAASLEAANALVGPEQTQSGNASTAHLPYIAMLSGVDSVEDIEFSENWAVEHQGTIKRTGLLRIRVQLPTDVASVESLTLEAPSAVFYTSNAASATTSSLTLNFDGGADVSSSHILTGYLMMPWEDVTIAANTSLALTMRTTDYDVYHRSFAPSDAVVFSCGQVNAIKLKCNTVGTNVDLDDFAGGTGVSGDMVDDQTKYFKMIADVDMTGESWTHLNAGSGYKKSVDFDGNNKTISNLGKDFFYVFKGSIYDLTLDHFSVTARGILAEYCQGTGHTITNVTVSNGTVNSTGTSVGGFIGRINSGSGTVATITDCTVSNTNVTGAGITGGFVGFPEQLVVISGCKFTGGTVTSSGQYVGGFFGSTGDYASTITNCQVEAATVNVNYRADARGGGFVGQLQNSVIIRGCTVGTPSAKVTINTKEPTKTDNVYNVINAGGFVGVCYGKITKNDDVRGKAYVKITSTNTVGTPLKLGGFVGFHAGNIEYSDAIVDMTSLKGQHIGGFAGYATKNNAVRAGRLDNCTADGPVTGNNYTGGFVGYVDASGPEISNCSASGSVTAQSGCGGFVGQTITGVFTNCSTSMTCSFSGSNNGGFVGQIHGGTMTGCSSSGSVTATGGSTYGGFVGLITNNGTTLDKCSSSSNLTDENGSYNGGFGGIIEKGTILIKRCYASGNITSDKTCAAGFIANINHASNTINITIQNCYSTGNIIKSNQIRGGFIAQIGTVTSATISNCYASGAVVGSFRLGGLIGNVGAANISVDHCAAWNSEVTASSHGSANWSSGAVVGTAFPSCTLTDSYRKPDMPVLAYWGNVTGYTYLLADNYQHANVDASNTLIKQNGAHSTATSLASGQDGYPHFPYHGKVEAGKTLSQLASSTLGWSADIWDFSGPLPLLK